MHDFFRILSVLVSRTIGSLWALVIALAVILITGYRFGFSVAWQGNVAFSISLVTLLVLVFLQKTQNHNDKATHLKLDELVKSSKHARNEVVSAENKAERDIDMLKQSIIEDALESLQEAEEEADESLQKSHL